MENAESSFEKVVVMKRAKKDDKTKKSRGSLSQYGLFDIPGDNDLGLDDSGGFDDDLDDDDLEDELNRLMGTSTKPPPPPPRAAARPGAVSSNKLDSMLTASLKDVPSDEEDEDVDEDDPQLLAELSELTGTDVEIASVERSSPPSVPPPSAPPPTASSEDIVTLLKERLTLYAEAEQAAKQNNDASKARRIKRGLDQCKALLRKAETGGIIDEEEIPVPISVPKPAPPASAVPSAGPPSDAASEPTPAPGADQNQEKVTAARNEQHKQEVIATLTARRDQYKVAAVAAKRRNDMDNAFSYIRIIRQFDVILEAVEKGQPVDLSTMPPPPEVPGTDKEPEVRAPAPTSTSGQTPTAEETPQDQIQGTEEPLTVLSALESRLAKYVEQEENAKRDGNQSKARRMGRIAAQYRDAINLHKKGKPIPVDELPTPPGFPPIPVEGSDKEPPSTQASGILPNAVSSLVSENVTPPSNTLSPSASGGIAQSRLTPPTSPTSKPGASPTPSQASTASSIGGAQTRNERQLAVLMLRCKEYREAALKAKLANNLVKAKEYLIMAKGLAKLIDAAKSGLPIDMDTIPRSLSKKSPELDTFEVIRLDDCIEGSNSEIFERLLRDLKNQIKMCVETLNHFKAMGDVANANRFENLAVNVQRDYNTVRGAHISNSPVPKFHYEQRSFSIVKCNVDLNDNDLELNIIKGINYNVPNPKEIDTYVRYEFPGLNDEVRTEKTSTVYNTNNPEYKTVFMIPIQRSSRPFQRLFKRHSIKLQIWSKGGFLRSDQMIATVQIKLQPLETKCTIHDAFDLMDGRRQLGGKLEVKVRVRNPIVTKQIEQINEKWLVID